MPTYYNCSTVVLLIRILFENIMHMYTYSACIDIDSYAPGCYSTEYWPLSSMMVFEYFVSLFNYT